MERNLELEAVIEENVDDEHAYLVYGDWLQMRGDPRGELIALQAAARRNPGDKKLAKLVDEYIEEHADHLLGPLGDACMVSWHLGFIRDARFLPDKDDSVSVLLEHPSGRFVQTLIVERARPAKIVELLLAKRKPATLANLRLGRDWDVAKEAPSLFEVFPRLDKSLEVEWRRIAAEVTKQRKTDLKYEPSTLPVLATQPNIESPGVDNALLLRALKLEVDKGRDLGVVAAMKRTFTRESLDAFAVALADQFAELGEQTSLRWGFQTLGLLGDARAVEWIADRFGTWSHQRAVQGARMLANIQSGIAVWELYSLVSDPRNNRPRRDDSVAALQGVAAQRKLDVDRLLDRSLPPMHERAMRMQNAVTRRLEAHMIDGRRISQTEFVHYFASHPLVAPLARRLVWATYDRGVVEATFRIDERGNALDADDSPIELDDAVIGVLHPAEAEPEMLVVWKRAFEKIKPLFAQLERPVLTLRAQESGAVLTRFKLRSVGFDRLRAVLDHELDWAPITEEMDAGTATLGWQKHFRRDDVTAAAMLNERFGAIVQVKLTRDGAPIDFARVHPVTRSEVLYALERATTSSQHEKSDATDGEVEKGMRVKINKGPGRLREGVVFWIGERNGEWRVGLRTDDDETLWANRADVRRLSTDKPPDSGPVKKTATKAEPDDEPAPLSFAKGAHVRWKKGRNQGTGIAFWIGKNKFGDGMRVGVKDDETGETVWADANDCEPTGP